METRIYKVESSATSKVTAVLEAEDKFDVKAKCSKCGKVLEGIFGINEISKYDSKEDSRGKIKPPEKKCECGGEYKFEKKALKANEFARNGYVFRGGYIQIHADKSFFDKNEPALIKEGAVLVKGKEADDVIKKIKEEEESAASGMGMIFG